MSQPEFDVVVFGATSFVGQILTQYLFDRHGAGSAELRWALAGRSQAKLAQVRGGLGESAADLPLIVADAADSAALTALCSRTRAVISTVGPYALYGTPLVEACVDSGTDYCDLTGEVQWIDEMIRRFETRAQASGARIVHCCGFDSIPSDLGQWVLQQASQRQLGAPCTTVKMRVKALRGGFSGGTVASLMNVFKLASEDPALRKKLGDPYLLCPDDRRGEGRQPNVKGPALDPDFQAWVAPFVMAGINTRVVQRSNALSQQAWGTRFRYDEAMLTGKGFKGRLSAIGLTAGLGGFLLGAALPPTRWVLERFVVPKPGEGPSPAAQASGFFDLRFHGTTDDGRSMRAKVTGDRDPGYGSTGKMLGEAGACLARDIPDLPGGFWTPATAFGQKLVDRLQDHAGLHFEVAEG
ncbi:saccharopine dehydrogenase NADP-binding domain-containing protein [Flagellatimonas centrodinii]|uniref:saccharopine dehydrogenase family protein n=1 Tax=Flagellatimonas centrodinii TaxID=2806210 RepID=UPI001FEEEE9A|nr:saccharopine dehydrogenase NADP-binding domain-containing protein [Flagellatimonas centrodinii]ULQ45156.1 saccharopine dehydrogenase NADP-binding domain-containing protein [Flagellatimonas centrodinii]